MKQIRFALTCMSFLALLACPKKEADKTPPAEKQPVAQQAQPTPGAQAGLPATAGQGKMMHCPSTVEGAQTAISDAPDSVVVTVTGPDDKAAGEIRARAKHLAEVSVKNPEQPKHDGEGDGGGGLGNCPIVLAGTTITAEDVPNGSKLTMKPAKADDLSKLKQAANDRKSKLGAPAVPAPKPMQ
jgi:hypothetical protein